MTRGTWALASLGGAVLVAGLVPLGCSHSAGPSTPTYLDRETLLDPQTCGTCHADHYKDWVGSMHAYASDDPVFQAMNARGQRETGGQLGSFCVQCHAPMALEEGATTDGTNMASVPQKLKGVTCFFCHTIDAVTGSHNAAVTLSGDLVMRGEYTNPVANTGHASAYAVLQDRDHIESASMCGACHDIVAPPGAAIERTYAEWQSSIFADPDGGETCGQCHMDQSTTPKPIAQAPNVGPRNYHAHDFPAVDVALTSGFPNAAAEQQNVTTFLQTTLQAALCVTQTGTGVRVIVDNVSAGHFFPSGASQDRRVWAEVIASKGGQTFYSSGVVPVGTPVVSVQNDPDLWLLRDCMFDATGKQVDMFWQAATTVGNELTMPVTTDKTDPRYYQTHIYQRFPRALGAAPLPQAPDQVTMRIRVQPIGLDVLNDLVDGGDLEAGVAGAMPTFDVAPLLTWTPAGAAACQTGQGAPCTYQDDDGEMVTCVTPTGFNVAADKNLATENAGCTP
jgi:nitrate/TMAO reductase-like tetraheme cytochrome c subunit